MSTRRLGKDMVKRLNDRIANTRRIEPFRVTVKIDTPNGPDVTVTIPMLAYTARGATRAVIDALCTTFDDCEIVEAERDVTITRA